MTWPGTTAPTAPPRGRRRKTARRGVPGVERAIAAAMRRDGLLARVPKDTRGVCIAHAWTLMPGFRSAFELALFVDDWARAKQRGRPLRRVRLPSWKVPEGVRRVVAVRCACGTIRGCPKCSDGSGVGGWGFTFHMARVKAVSP